MNTIDYASLCQSCGACCSYFAYNLGFVGAESEYAYSPHSIQALQAKNGLIQIKPKAEVERLLQVDVKQLKTEERKRYLGKLDRYEQMIDLYNDQTVYSLKTRRDEIGYLRCGQLKGKLGDDVSCGVYEDRPAMCKLFEPGSDKCLRARDWLARAEVERQSNASNQNLDKISF